MSTSPQITPHLAEVTQQNFEALVLERSRAVPVAVDFWATWCAPCRMLMPLLAKLAGEYDGKFFLAKVNTDQERELAARYGIRSLPTVKLFRNGAVVDEFMGALPEQALREFLDAHIPRASDTLLDRARRADQAGDHDQALALLRQALALDPANDQMKIELARLLFERGDHEQSAQILNGVSSRQADAPGASGLRARLEFARIAGPSHPPDERQLAELHETLAANPADCEARYRLSALAVLRGDYDGALAQLLEIVKRDRRFRDDAGRRGVLAVFNILGGQGELVQKYRTLLASALY